MRSLSRSAAMASCSRFITTFVAGSFFGLTRREWPRGGEGKQPPSLMMRLSPRLRRRSGISCSSGLTEMSVAGANPKEREPEDDEDGISMRLGVQELPQQREKESVGYSSDDSLPPSMCASTAERVRLGVPHH
ncbi:hypothetical protein D1007_39977 [Hordeum vulgare]|nr:hypothetical protein D1007_39977 [Hordeum vulgare]